MLEQLCRERYGRLVAMATMLLGSSHGAEDLVQEALIAVFRKRRTFPSVAAAEGYVRRAIATKFLDGARKSTKEFSALKRHASQEATADAPAPATASAADAEALLSQLPPRVRACVALRFLDDMSVAETARALGLSEGAVKRYVSDGLATLNAAMGSNLDARDLDRSPVLPPRRTNV
jgi:RNA polymerase sigma factor (sigma-70 family)